MSNAAETANSALIPQGAAYGLLIGLSIVFCGIILLSIKIQKDYLAEDSGQSEMFMVSAPLHPQDSASKSVSGRQSISGNRTYCLSSDK